MTKEEQKQHLIDIMKGDEELGLYEHGQEVGQSDQVEARYTEEEVYNLLEKLMWDCDILELEEHYDGDFKNLKSWFEQFKKQ